MTRINSLLLLSVSIMTCVCSCTPLTGEERTTKIIEATKEGDLELVKKLVEDDNRWANSTQEGGSPIVYYAAANGHQDIVQYLIESGVDVNARSRYGGALHVAVQSENLNIVRTLVEHGANVNLVDDWNTTPLHLTTQNKDAQVASLLVSAGASVSLKDNKGRTPLHRCKNVGVARVLVAHGADVNAKDREGLTPLHWAATPREIVDLPTIRYLISSGADLGAKDNKGMTPCDLAKKSQEEQDDKGELISLICPETAKPGRDQGL